MGWIFSQHNNKVSALFIDHEKLQISHFSFNFISLFKIISAQKKVKPSTKLYLNENGLEQKIHKALECKYTRLKSFIMCFQMTDYLCFCSRFIYTHARAYCTRIFNDDATIH